jgi:pimeloyl-ACP methyl ester carboxylesterase
MDCSIRDLDVYCDVIGKGRPIVMVHGMGVDHRTMKGCMEPIFQVRDDEWKRIYFDLPGMGRTEGVSWVANSDDMFRFVLSVIDEVIPGESFSIVGESYGGYLARAVVRERPRDVAGMLLICPLIIADDEQRDVPPCVALQRDRALAERLDDEEKYYLDLFLVNHSEENWIRLRDEMVVGFESGDETFKARIRGDAASYAFCFDVDDLPVPFDGPSLIVTGRQDCLAGYRDAWKVVENYPRSSFVVLDGAGHGLQIEQAGLFETLAHEWLDRVSSSEG